MPDTEIAMLRAQVSLLRGSVLIQTVLLEALWRERNIKPTPDAETYIAGLLERLAPMNLSREGLLQAEAMLRRFITPAN